MDRNPSGGSAIPVESKLADAQQEVWDEELRYWRTRTTGKLEEHMSLWHDEVAAWGSMLQKPGNKADMRTNVAGILKDTRPGHYTCDLDLFNIRVEGDFARPGPLPCLPAPGLHKYPALSGALAR